MAHAAPQARVQIVRTTNGFVIRRRAESRRPPVRPDGGPQGLREGVLWHQAWDAGAEHRARLQEQDDDGDAEESWSLEQCVDFAVARDDEKEEWRERRLRCPGAFVIEGDWGLSFEASVRELLEFGRRFGRGVPYIYRRVTTRRQLKRAVREWRSKTDYPLLVLEMHGAPGLVDLAEGVEVTLEELAEMIGPYCGADRHVYFGGCEVFRDKRAVDAFKRDTGIGSARGNRQIVSWPRGCVQVMRLLAELSERTLP
jgi:hypothetical protein